MSDATVRHQRAQLETAIALGRLLERVERSPEPIDPDQYQALVARLKAVLADDLPEPALNAVLGALPAAAELYENLHYGLSGLSRAPLARSIASEQLATQLLARVRQAR
jgi:hypothetical protein